MKGSSRRVILPRACFMAVVLLFSQFAIAAQACVLPTMAPSMVFSGGADPEPCGDMSSNVCLMQFLQGDQAVDFTEGLLTAPSFVSPLVIALNERAAALTPAGTPFAHKTGPPIRTRLCRLLI